MTGTYASFKGKLKVGDRVRVEYGGRTSLGEVNETSESGFTVRENMDEWRCVERFIFWTSEGTLELLSPSPRVVTDTEAPSLPLIAKFTVKARGSVDYNNIIKMTNPTDKDVYSMVWDASPPAPAEKEEEWWEEYTQLLHFADGSLEENVHVKDIPKIVTEAKRRGAEEAWKEAKCIIEAQKKYRGIISTAGGDFILLVRLVEAIDAKLDSLNKPAGAGEK